MTVGSLFSGVGGFDLGFERAGAHVLWQVEADPQARSVLRRHWPDATIHEDVRNVGRSNLAPVDLICGGFPCQDLSVAGRRAGLAGKRSGLFYEFMRVASEFAPRWVLIENVPGLLSSNEGRDMGAVLGTLGELGYWWTYRVTDSRFWGVAQRRRRVLIIGHLGAPCPPEVLLEPEGVCGDPEASGEAGEVAPSISASGAGTARTGNERNEAEAIVLADPLVAKEGATYTHEGRGNFRLRNVVFKPSHYTRGKDGAPSELAPPLSADADQDLVALAFSENQRAEVRTGNISRQLTAGGGKPGQGYPATLDHHGIPRRLTPRECERLQGFPDDWTRWGLRRAGRDG